MSVLIVAILLIATSIRTSYSFVVHHPLLTFNRPSSSRASSSTSSLRPLHILRNPNDGTSSFDNDDHHDHDHQHPRRAEFEIREDEDSIQGKGQAEQNDLRKLRIAQEKQNQETFTAYGNDLWDLRSQLDALSKKLVNTMASGGDTKHIRQQLRELEGKDGNLVYGLELDRMDQALDEGRVEDAAGHRDKALNARSHLAQFNLEGLWIGKYGDNGFELVNITYTGDTLIARKVTGDKTVPSGEITFQVDLSPHRHTLSLEEQTNRLPNIELSERASIRWGNRELQRFEGLGHVASDGFVNSEWLEGQLVMISEEYFSFSWLPLSFQVFFGRPAPEVQLKMMQEAMESGTTKEKKDLDSNVEHLTRCFEATTDALEDGTMDDTCSIIFDDEICCFE